MTELTMKELLCLELSLTEGIGLKRISDLYAAFRSIEAIWSAPLEALRKVIPLKQAVKIAEGPNPERTQRMAVSWQERHVQFCTRESSIYPRRLREIYDAPPVLYYAGDPSLLATEMMAVVGARRCTPYGRHVAEEIGYRLAGSGYTVVSGMAYGIDGYSHQGALKAHGKTIAVLANGVDICYPQEHYALWEQIRHHGLLISEYPPGTEPRSGFFPLRNRIISGLCQGVVIVEAAAQSGSLITADQALEQGRDVYCVPGQIYSSMSCGVHRLVQQGAILLSSMEDLPVAVSARESKTIVGMNAAEMAVYQALEGGGALLHEIVHAVERPFQEVLQTLSVLEIRGLIQQTEEQRWVRIYKY